MWGIEPKNDSVRTIPFQARYFFGGGARHRLFTACVNRNAIAS